jgi:hypothetical protein
VLGDNDRHILNSSSSFCTKLGERKAARHNLAADLPALGHDDQARELEKWVECTQFLGPHRYPLATSPGTDAIMAEDLIVTCARGVSTIRTGSREARPRHAGRERYPGTNRVHTALPNTNQC